MARMASFLTELTTSPVASAARRLREKKKGRAPTKADQETAMHLEATLKSLGQGKDSVPFLTSQRSGINYDPSHWNLVTTENGSPEKRIRHALAARHGRHDAKVPIRATFGDIDPSCKFLGLTSYNSTSRQNQDIPANVAVAPA